MTNENAETELTVSVFYRTGRAGAQRLAGGGGPFGFDIAVALMVDELIRRLGCDAVAETGCFAGDTTYYLARRYPDLPVYSCDTDGSCAAFTAARLAGCPNAAVTYEDSLAMLGRVASRHARPLAFLDAHWGAQWPLVAELDIVTAAAGVAVVHDFDIGHDRFSYDSYDGVACGPAIGVRPGTHRPTEGRASRPGTCPVRSSSATRHSRGAARSCGWLLPTGPGSRPRSRADARVLARERRGSLADAVMPRQAPAWPGWAPRLAGLA